MQLGPLHQSGATTTTIFNFDTEMVQDAHLPSGEAIGGPEERRLQACCAVNIADDVVNHGFRPASRNFSPNNKSGGDTHGGSKPQNTLLRATPEFIGLNLSKVKLTLTDEMLLNTLRVFTSFVEPVGNGALIQLEGHDDGGNAASKHQQRQHDNNEVMLILETKERGIVRPSEGFRQP